jgi:hypothetical protein
MPYCGGEAYLVNQVLNPCSDISAIMAEVANIPSPCKSNLEYGLMKAGLSSWHALLLATGLSRKMYTSGGRGQQQEGWRRSICGKRQESMAVAAAQTGAALYGNRSSTHRAVQAAGRAPATGRGEGSEPPVTPLLPHPPARLGTSFVPHTHSSTIP